MIVPISAGNAIQMIVSSIVRDEPSQQGLLRATRQNQGLVEAQIPCGSATARSRCVWRIQGYVRTEKGAMGGGRFCWIWAPLVSTTPRPPREFRKSLIL